MKNFGFLFRFSFLLMGLLVVAFSVHIWFRGLMEMPILGDFLISCYILNFLVAFGIVALLQAFKEKLKYQIGFLYLGGSLIKFLVFFLFLYPEFKADGKIQTSEFAAFFVPYVLSLVLETIFLSKMLRTLEEGESKR